MGPSVRFRTSVAVWGEAIASLGKVPKKVCRAFASTYLVSVLVWTLVCVPASRSQDQPPLLLLTPQRLRRLQRDRERQTVRWVNFENRVNTATDSQERGFELALYYAVTHDEASGREAIQWGLANRCALRQVALILDWCGALASDGERRSLSAQNGGQKCAGNDGGGMEPIRDALFMAVARGESSAKLSNAKQLEAFALTQPEELYAASEYLEAVRETEHVDLREEDAAFFRFLPIEYLLAMKPDALEHPKWQAPIAALALVSLDPNLEGSQFLQGWAMEDRQMIHEGAGVAYELLWGDPYLPGVSYQNLEPWSYNPNGRLFARTDWNADSCWIAITAAHVDEVNCPPGWRRAPQVFGRMTLVPMTEPCVDAPRVKEMETAIVWGLPPHQTVWYVSQKKRVTSEADAAGLWQLPGNIEGKICRAPVQK